MTPTNNEQQEPRKGPQSGTPGALLRQAREAGGHTHATVADALHLTVHYIKSLENDDYSKLPGLIFVKGYMRSYGHFLKIDVDNLMACYDAHMGALPEVKSQTLAGNYTRKRSDQAIGWAVAAALVVLMGLGAGWWFFGRQEPALASTLVSPQPAVEQANRITAAARLNTVPAASTAAPTQTYATASPVVGSNTNNTLPNTSGTTLQPGQMNGAQSSAQQGEPLASTVLPTLPTADVVSGAATILSAAAGQDKAIVAVAPGPAVVDPLTPTAAATPAAGLAASVGAPTVTPTPAGGRQINLIGAGADQMQLTFTGNSWVEIDDGRNVRLYNEMLLGGDALLVQGQAPFHVLFGDGRNVTVTFNASPIDIGSSIRSDSTSRITLSNPVTMTVPLETAADSSPTAPAATATTSTTSTTPPEVTGNAGAVP